MDLDAVGLGHLPGPGAEDTGVGGVESVDEADGSEGVVVAVVAPELTGAVEREGNEAVHSVFVETIVGLG